MSIRKIVSAVALAAVASACAGRDPQMTATVQPQDRELSCSQINAEIEANNTRITALQKESSGTTGSNIALAVVGGLLFWPALFALDLKDGAGKEAQSLNQRQSYLGQLMGQRGCGGLTAMR